MKKISDQLARQINERMIAEYSPGEMVGIKEPELLNSAIERPFQTMFGDPLYPDIFTKATALFESLAKNHVFYNGNKRSAFACMTYFLFINGYICLVSEKEGADLTVEFVTKDRTFEDIVQLLKENTYAKTIS